MTQEFVLRKHFPTVRDQSHRLGHFLLQSQIVWKNEAQLEIANSGRIPSSARSETVD